MAGSVLGSTPLWTAIHWMAFAIMTRIWFAGRKCAALCQQVKPTFKIEKILWQRRVRDLPTNQMTGGVIPAVDRRKVEDGWGVTVGNNSCILPESCCCIFYMNRPSLVIIDHFDIWLQAIVGCLLLIIKCGETKLKKFGFENSTTKNLIRWGETSPPLYYWIPNPINEYIFH